MARRIFQIKTKEYDMKILTVLFIFTVALTAQTATIDSLENELKTNPAIDIKYQLARAYHDAVRVNENDDYTERAELLFEEILKEKRDHAEAMTMYGSLKTIMGRDAFLPWNKMKYVEQGCDKMDKAVQLAPDNLNIRITRALNNINLPSFFNRITYCLEDFEFIQKHPAFSHFNPGIKLQIFYYSAKAFETNEQVQEAKEMYAKAVALNLNNKLSQEASASLSDLSE